MNIMYPNNKTISYNRHQNKQVVNPVSLLSPIVWFSPETMYNGSALALENEKITSWQNSISDSLHAVQTDTTKQPLVKVVGGLKEVQFDGSNDFLNMFRPAELDFQKNESFSTVVITGSNVTSGYMICKGLQSLKQYATWFGSDYLNVEAFGGSDSWIDTEPIPSNSVSIVSVYNHLTEQISLYYNGVHQLTTDVTTSSLYPLNDTLLGARHTSTANNSYGYFYGGSLRNILMFNKALNLSDVQTLHNNLI